MTLRYGRDNLMSNMKTSVSGLIGIHSGKTVIVSRPYLFYYTRCVSDYQRRINNFPEKEGIMSKTDNLSRRDLFKAGSAVAVLAAATGVLSEKAEAAKKKVPR